MDLEAAAERIAEEHNRGGSAMQGGVLAFNPDGSGGQWYSMNTTLPPQVVRVRVMDRHMTSEDAREILRQWYEDREETDL